MGFGLPGLTLFGGEDDYKRLRKNNHSHKEITKSKEDILKKIKERKTSWEKLLTKNSNNVIDVDLEIGIRINELDEVIKLFE